jgi:hypothetical protein
MKRGRWLSKFALDRALTGILGLLSSFIFLDRGATKRDILQLFRFNLSDQLNLKEKRIVAFQAAANSFTITQFKDTLSSVCRGGSGGLRCIARQKESIPRRTASRDAF